MNKIIFFLIGVLSIACSSDDKLEPIDNPEPINNEVLLNGTDSTTTITYLNYTLKMKSEPHDPVHSKEYVLDEEGKVISFNFINLDNPQFNSFSTFEYNEDGRVIREIRNGELRFKIIWTNDFAEVFNSQDQKISEFTFVNDKLSKYKRQMTNNTITRKLNYDSNENIISIENETEIFVEFLEYDTTKIYPFNLIKSIGILQMDSKCRLCAFLFCFVRHLIFRVLSVLINFELINEDFEIVFIR